MTAPEPTRAVVPALPGSRLETLAALYAERKPAADEAAALLEEVKAALKIELANAAPEADDITLQAADSPPLRLRWKGGMAFQQKKFKAADPLTYARYCEPSGHWELGKG